MRVRRALMGAALCAVGVVVCAGLVQADPSDGSTCTAGETTTTNPTVEELCPGGGDAPPVDATTVAEDAPTTTVAEDAPTTTVAEDAAATTVVEDAPATSVAEDAAALPTTTPVVAGTQPDVALQQQVGEQQQVGGTKAVDDAATTPKDTPVVIDVLANDSTTFAANLVIDGFTDPKHGTVARVAGGVGTLRYTPDAGFVGTDPFDVRVCAANVVAEADPCGISTVTVSVTGTASAAATTSTAATTTTAAPGPSPPTAATECADCVTPQTTPTTVAHANMALTGGSWERSLGGLGLLALAGGSALLLVFAGGTFRGAIPDRTAHRYRRRHAAALRR